MKKIFVTMLTFLATFGAGYALPVGNPSEASLLSDGIFWCGGDVDVCDPCMNWCDSWSLRIGFYGDYVFNRHMKNAAGPTADTEVVQLTTNAGYLALNFLDRFDIFSTLGATNYSIDTSLFNFTLGAGSNNNRFEVESDTRFSWSVGARATLWECGCTALGIEGQYFSARPHVKKIYDSFQVSVAPNTNSHYREWQVGLGISHRINMLVPYVAVKWSSARLFMNNEIPTGSTFELFTQKNQKHWGYAVGCSLIACERASLNIEGRFADEKAVAVNGQIRF